MSHAIACSDVAVLPPKNGIGDSEAIGGAGSEERHDPYYACSLCCPFWGSLIVVWSRQ